MIRGILPFCLILPLEAFDLFLPGAAKARALRLVAVEFLGQNIRRPPGTWILLLRADHHCLYYRTPLPGGTGPGEILWGKNCPAQDLLFQGMDILERVSGVEEFSFDYALQGGQGTLTLAFLLEGRERTLSFSLISLENVTGKPYSFFLPQKLVGGPLDSYKRGTAQACHRVDGECRDVLENTCHRCRYGFVEVIDYNCPQGGSKFCGLERCGNRGDPACPLGLSWAHPTFRETPCQEHSPVGHCLRGLHQMCDENNILICL